MEDEISSSEFWDAISAMLPGERERRLAYLLYVSGLKPRQVVQFCPEEWPNIREVHRLRRNIVERLLRNSDQLRWRLEDDGQE